MSEKISYRTIVAMNMAAKHLLPGDHLTLTLHSEEDTQGIFSLAKRINEMFLLSFAFYPQEIAIHPDHLAILKKQGKSLDITIGEQVAPLLGAIVELSEIPRRIPLVADESLDLFTAVARFTFGKEEAADMLIDALKYMFQTGRE